MITHNSSQFGSRDDNEKTASTESKSISRAMRTTEYCFPLLLHQFSLLPPYVFLFPEFV